MIKSSVLFETADKLDKTAKDVDLKDLEQLKEAADDVGRSWNGSWLGYHSRVYYKDFSKVPPGARFSMGWGFIHSLMQGTIGEWKEYDFDDVVSEIFWRAGNPDIDKYQPYAKKAKDNFEEAQYQHLSIMTTTLEERENDSFLEDLLAKIKELKVLTQSDIIAYMRPKGQLMSRDTNAYQAGLQSPPHVSVIASIGDLRFPFEACEKLSKLAKQGALHVANLEKSAGKGKSVGANVL